MLPRSHYFAGRIVGRFVIVLAIVTVSFALGSATLQASDDAQSNTLLSHFAPFANSLCEVVLM